jgi:CheY-like chemotaxis protein
MQHATSNVTSPHTRHPRLGIAATTPIHILLAEDDASDVMLTESALDAAAPDCYLHTLRNGADVLPYLSGQGKYRGQPRADMLMLDLSLPGKDGFEVLAELAARSERYGDLPIVILTGDRQCAFLSGSCELNIAAYLTKPCSPEKMQQVMTAIRDKRMP